MALQINPLLDTNYLEQAYGEDATIIHMIFDAFLSDSLPRWYTLKQALDEEDMEQAASILHGLKPSFTMAGLTWIRPKVEIMEKAVKDGATISSLKEQYEQISEEINQLMPILETESERLRKV
ncbi:Hpt domain-containing protein [Dyadobacter sp. NIV53]|uniref:Hpt domain-containing protein n=1 Tax=Dyadobacter sp. NIV53 TaxID=2861765 RepID=UPI001C880410|nr:Hpt domain-containing protein [Dyadobacter sp. NIV53]